MQLGHIEALIDQGNVTQGIAALKEIADQASIRPGLLQQVGQLFTYVNLHVDAERCYARAARIEPANAAYLYNWATSLIALGKLDYAESLLTRVLALSPQDYDAYYNRATLRKQTPASNHIAQLEAALSVPPAQPAGVVALCYALAKELEDIGEHRRSFAMLERGAGTRRRMLSYKVEADVEAMEQIATVFDQRFFSTARAGCPDARPIFVLGLPRSGTTLVDRILSSHSAVGSRGETVDFTKALLHEAGACGTKRVLIERSATVSFELVGARYCATLSGHAERLIDKTPLNFLYLGLIASALPRARIVHVRRDPMDVCYAMYKTLFRMAYPFSYDLADLGHYYLAYHRLMEHWRAVLPDAFLDIDYEELVSDQVGSTRRLLAHCGLDWQGACLAFHRNESPCLTASAAQVRKPIYRSSVGLWRQYRQQLEPLAEVLRAGGLAWDDA